MLNSDESPFMLPKPDLNQVKHDLLKKYPDLQLKSVLTEIRQKTVAIINTANRPWAIVDSAYLFSILQGFQVKEFYFSTGLKAFQSDGQALDANMQLAESLNELVSHLSDFKPSTLYLRVSPHTKSEPLITLCRIYFPDVTLIVEPYDMSCLFTASALGDIDKDGRYYDEAMMACAVALHYCQGLVVKMGGQRFEHWQKPKPEIMLTFFPTSAYRSAKASRDEFDENGSRDEVYQKRQILYAGSASARELIKGMGSMDGANLIGYFDRIIQDERFYLSIINGAHFFSKEDNTDKFSKLLERYAKPDLPSKNCSYQRAMTLAQLGVLAKNFDLGICCAHYAEDQVVEVTRVSIPNRMTTYINAELPVIIDDRFEFAASLIEEFNAGKVIPAGDFESFANGLAEIDIKTAREGVQRLKRFFQDQNNKNLASLLLAFQ